MKRINKTRLGNRSTAILRGNDGASIVLVTIIAILIITGVIILRTTTSALWASADKQLSQDQAYEMATSMGNSLDELIIGKNLNLDSLTYTTATSADGKVYSTANIFPSGLSTPSDLPNSSIEATVIKYQGSDIYTVEVEAHVAKATYIYTANYTKSGANFKRQY